MSNPSAHDQDSPNDGVVNLPAHPDAGQKPGTVPAVDVTASLRDQAQAYVTQRKADVARAVSDVAEAFRVGGANLDGFPLFKAACARAALEVDGLADTISNHTVGEIAHGVGAAVRRRPGIAAAAAVTAGAAVVYLARRPGARLKLRSLAKRPISATAGTEA